MAGYLLSDVIGEDIDTYLLPIIAVIIIVSLIPPFLEWRKAKKHPATGERRRSRSRGRRAPRHRRRRLARRRERQRRYRAAASARSRTTAASEFRHAATMSATSTIRSPAASREGGPRPHRRATPARRVRETLRHACSRLRRERDRQPQRRACARIGAPHRTGRSRLVGASAGEPGAAQRNTTLAPAAAGSENG